MRTSLFRRAQRALALAEPALAIAPRALTRRAALTLGAAALAACAARSAPRRRESIAIIGAGAAGLVAAHRLADRADCAIYEASNRVGGRMFTQRNFTAEGQFCELGGELVDSGHKALIDLAGELGVGIQRIAPEGETDADLYAVGGKLYRASDMIDPATGAGAFAPIARRIAADQAALLDDDDNWTARAEALDRTSLKDYLNALRPEAERWAVDLLDLAYLGEYGRPTSEQSALNLVDFISVGPGPFAMFGDSDEAHRIAGGSSALIEALSAAIAGRAAVSLGHELRRITVGPEGIDLWFAAQGAQKVIRADRAIVAIPFTRLRSVEGIAALGLAEAQLEAIQSLGYGNNAKLMVATNGRPWRDRAMPGSFDGGVYADTGIQIVWDTSRGQPGEGGILTNFTAAERSDLSEEELASTLVAGLAGISPATAASIDAKRRAAFFWNRHPQTLGSYTCPAPGQYTRLLEAAAAPALGGRIHFAGEHTSQNYQGFMNGAVESGERAAAAVIGA